MCCCAYNLFLFFMGCSLPFSQNSLYPFHEVMSQLHGIFCFWALLDSKKVLDVPQGTPPGFFFVRLAQNQNLLMDLAHDFMKRVSVENKVGKS